MDVRITLFDAIVFFGILQSLLATGILVSKRKNIASRLFCALLFVFSLISFKILVHTLHFWQHPRFTYFPLAIDTLIQPLFYFYFLSISKPNFYFKRGYLYHFIPCALFILHATIVYLATINVEDGSRKAIIANQLSYNRIKEVEDILSVISAFVYTFLAYRVVAGQPKVTGKEKIARQRWLNTIIILFLVFSIVLMVNIILEYGFTMGLYTFLHWKIFYIYLSFFIYFISITSLRSPELAILPAVFSPVKVKSEQEVILAQKIREVIETEKLYCIPEFSIQDLAKRLNTGVSSVSYVINHHHKSSFRDLINGYRIEHIKKMLVDSKHQNLSILGMAYETGFASEASFYRIFKSKVGLSPREYQNLNKSIENE
jgi:AraC-like DNA-binding protein